MLHLDPNYIGVGKQLVYDSMYVEGFLQIG